MFTFRDYYIAEAAGIDSNDTSEVAAQQDHFVDMTTEVRKVMQALDMASEVEDGEHGFTFIDLVEALKTLEEVIMGRLSTEGAMVDDGRGGEKHVDTAGSEHWEGDASKGYARFFESIRQEAKEAINNVFGGIPKDNALGGTGEEGEQRQAPRFVRAFNTLIVDRIVDAMQEMGPDRARQAVPGIIGSAKRAVVQQQQSRGSETSGDLRDVVQKYRTSRKRTIGSKRAGSRTRTDRSRLKQHIHR